MIGIDTAKSIFQLHAIDATGEVQFRRKLRRDELLPFLEQQARCTVVMEACGSAHHWGRVLSGLGFEVKLIASGGEKSVVSSGRPHKPRSRAGVGGQARTGSGG
jgi:error-prone DNA polymerase